MVAVHKGADAARLQQLFLETRLLYKKMEWAAEYFMPGTTRFVNGAPLPEIETEEHIVKDPEGLQVMEALIYPVYDTAANDELNRQLLLLKANCIRYRDYFTTIQFDEAQLFDAARLQLFRILTMGITGFDAALSQNSMAESAESLQAVRAVLAPYITNEQDGRLDRLFKDAIIYLQQHKAFNGFDRAHFIITYGNPLCSGLAALQQKTGVAFMQDNNRLLRTDAVTLFDSNAFNINAFVPDSTYYANAQKTALGKKLFADRVLSGNGQRSCASCHNPDKAYADGLAKNTVLDGNGLLLRNTPSLLNAAMQAAQFYDLRATILENQAMTVITNKDEMHGSMEEASARLQKDTAYQRLFKDAFPGVRSTGIQPAHIMNALGSFVRSLTSFDSRFDQYMRGQNTAMNKEEIQGFNLFMGKAKCGTCHFMPLFNGTVPPTFKKTESEVIGVPADKTNRMIDTDEGRFRMTAVEPFRHAFKTTTVRNTTLTAPYMHNGIWQTLEEVIDFYDRGGGAGSGFRVDNQTLPFDKLNLTAEEKKAVIAFIGTLSSQ